MTDPRTTAQQLGPEAMEALVREVLAEIPRISEWPRTFEYQQATILEKAICAARKLAEPDPVAPKWPSGKLWAWFGKQDGIFQDAEERCAEEVLSDSCISLPCRIVPADAVVLTREEADDIDELLIHMLGDTARNFRAALRREREGQ